MYSFFARRLIAMQIIFPLLLLTLACMIEKERNEVLDYSSIKKSTTVVSSEDADGRPIRKPKTDENPDDGSTQEPIADENAEDGDDGPIEEPMTVETEEDKMNFILANIVDPIEPPDLEPEPVNNLPGLPSIMREVVFYRDGEETRPHIPPMHSSRDGRVNMAGRGRTSNPDDLVFDFYLFSPERIKTSSFLNSPNGPEILASKDPIKLRAGLFVGDPNFASVGETRHNTLCDRGQNPRACGTNNSQDCYDLVVITSYLTEIDGDDWITLWGTEIIVEVDNPKTARAAISSITTGTPKEGIKFQHTMLETHATEDGHIIAARGLKIDGGFGLVYSNPETDQACDVTAYQGPVSFKEASNFPVLRNNWDFAKYPFLDGQGNPLEGLNTNRNYPMIDGKGKNIWFYTNAPNKLFSIENGQTVSEYEVRCVAGTNCVNPFPEPNEDDIERVEGDGNKELVTFRGAWTGGRAIVIDNMVNNLDYGFNFSDDAHRLVKIYEGEDGWIRMGGGSYNGGNASGRIGNSGFMDSIENRFNYLPQMKSPLPKDFSWWFSDGKGTDLVVFDDFVNPHMLIYSQMTVSTQTERIEDTSKIKKLIDNSVSGQLYKAPEFGRIDGHGRVEPAALGGVRGKGFWLHQGSALEYDLPSEQPRNLSNENWYVGLFLDPRYPNDDTVRNVICFPDQSCLGTLGRRSIVITADSMDPIEIALERPLPRNEFSHLGLRITGAGDKQLVEILRDGMLAHNIEVSNNVLGIIPGKIRLGSVPGKSGFVGWLDEFKVIGRAEIITDEQLCQHANGGLVGLTTEADLSLLAESNRYPMSFHNRVDEQLRFSSYARYLCFDHNRNQDGWVNMTSLPVGVYAVGTDLIGVDGLFVWNIPRKDSSDNNFCISCHSDDGTDFRPKNLSESALLAGEVPFYEDPTRNVILPERRIFGLIPTYFLKQMDPQESKIAPAEGFLIDPYLFPDSLREGMTGAK